MTLAATFDEFGIVFVKRGARGTCPGSGLGTGAPVIGFTDRRFIVECPRCHRRMRATAFHRLPTHKTRTRRRSR